MQIRDRHVLTLFFVSGFTALVLEVVWAKETCLIFGNTTLASASVVAAFMSGLALGSWIFGKIVDRRPESGLKLYGLLEGGIGLFALLFPLLLRGLEPLYREIYLRYHQDFAVISAIRFALSFAVLIVPTTLMGGTLPVLAKYLSARRESMKENLGRLYALNLFGAMAGTFASGFILLANFGIRLTSLLAAFLNLGILAFVWTRRESAGAPSAAAYEASGDPEEKPVDSKTFWLVVFLMFVHGFVAFVAQVCWTRMTGLVLGSSTYAFSAMLTTFLAGLGLGSWAVSRLAKKKIRLSMAAIGAVEIAVGMAMLLFIPVFQWIFYAFVVAFPFISFSHYTVFASQFAFSAIAMIVPTFLMGLVFPAILYHIGRPKDIGRVTGVAYASNTVGGVAGCFLGAFVFISTFELIGTLRAVSMLAVVSGAFVVWAASDRTRRAANLKKTAAAFLAALFLLSYPWSPHVFSSGVFVYASSYQDRAMSYEDFQRRTKQSGDLIFYKDGISSTVSVLRYADPAGVSKLTAKSLRVNGKTDASTFGDMATQLYAGYVPMFAHKNPRDVLVIGLGSGVTLGAVAQFDEVREMEVVEIEPAVVEANRFFSAENNYVLKDPRVRVVIGDGRNHIAFSPKEYDVIISEPSNPWISGISNLFTKENYELAIRKLREDGIYLQWMHSYQMSLEDFTMVLNTFQSSFPEVALFRANESDYLLVGSRKPIVFDHAAIQKRIRSNPRALSDIREFSEQGEHFLTAAFVASGTDLRKALAKLKTNLNTDDRLRLEYNAPKNLYRSTSAGISDWLASMERSDLFPNYEGWDREKKAASPYGWFVLIQRGLEAMDAKNPKRALKLFNEAWKLNPEESRIRFARGMALDALKLHRQAIREYATLRKVPVWASRAGSGIRRAKMRIVAENQPMFMRDVEWHNLVGTLSYMMGDVRGAFDALLDGIHVDPQYVKNYADMAVFSLSEGDESTARNFMATARRIDEGHPAVRGAQLLFDRQDNYRKTIERLREAERAIRRKLYPRAKAEVQSVLAEDPDNIPAHLLLAAAEHGLGNSKLAKEYVEKANLLREQTGAAGLERE